MEKSEQTAISDKILCFTPFLPMSLPFLPYSIFNYQPKETWNFTALSHCLIWNLYSLLFRLVAIENRFETSENETFQLIPRTLVCTGNLSMGMHTSYERTTYKYSLVPSSYLFSPNWIHASCTKVKTLKS